MSDYIIKVENLGKKYSIQHQGEREPYFALRDVIAGGVKGLGSRRVNFERELRLSSQIFH